MKISLLLEGKIAGRNSQFFDYQYSSPTQRLAALLNPNGTKTLYTYTALGELDTVNNQKADGSNLSFYNYDYDARGVRTQLQEQIEADPAKTLAFSYDPSNQLTGETVTGGQTGEAYSSSYAYDSAGNRKSWQKDSTGQSQLTRYTNNNLNQTQSASLTINGQRTTTGYSYDAAGNLSQATTENGSSDYTFDGANRLTSVINRNAAGEAVDKTEFVYDGLSRLRVSKDFTRQKVGWVAVAEKRRVYDGMNVVQERDGSGALVATYTRGLSMGGGIGGLLARSGDGVNLFYHYDGRGNVGQLTNAGGELAARYTYDAFGVLIGSSGAAASLNAYRFSTKEAIGSLVYYGYRFYSPSLGKWINRDPIKERGGANLYGFVNNEPTRRIDPVGHAISLGVALLIVGGLLVAAIIYNSGDFGTEALTPSEQLQVNQMLSKLTNCAKKTGNNQLVDYLSSNPIKGQFTPIGGTDWSGHDDSTSETRGQQDLLSPTRLILSANFFNRNCGDKYKTLIHESYHAGTGIGSAADSGGISGAGAATDFANKNYDELKSCLGCGD